MRTRILICGDRDWGKSDDKSWYSGDRLDDEALMWHILKYLISCYTRSGTIVLHGGARGADEMAGRLAEDYGVHTARIKALWASFGKGAGPMRNRVMAEFAPDLVVAFHRNIEESSGTADMLTVAEEEGIDYFLVDG